MGGSMTSKAKQRIARRQTYAQFPYLLKIVHEILGIFLYANSDKDITYKGNVYKAACFTLDPPDKDGSKIGDGQLTISAVDQEWIEKIRSTQIAAKITFTAMIVYNDGVVSGVESIEEMDFTLRNVSWGEDTITWTMVFDENMAILVPCDKCTALKTPGAA
jgi:hypothetical protein